MAADLTIDPKLLERAQELSGGKRKGAVVTEALTEYIACREQRCLFEMLEQAKWSPDYYRSERYRS